MKSAACFSFLAIVLLAGCSSWAAIPVQPSVAPRAQIWTGGRVIEVRDLRIATDSLRARSAGPEEAPLAFERSAADSVRVRRGDVLKTVLAVTGVAAAAVAVVGFSLRNSF